MAVSINIPVFRPLVNCENCFVFKLIANQLQRLLDQLKIGSLMKMNANVICEIVVLQFQLSAVVATNYTLHLSSNKQP